MNQFRFPAVKDSMPRADPVRHNRRLQERVRESGLMASRICRLINYQRRTPGPSCAIPRDGLTEKTMHYSIWAILGLHGVSTMSTLGGSVARCYSVMANIRRGWSQNSVSGRTTLRRVTVVQPVFAAFESGRSQLVPAGSPLILPDISARNSERFFFLPAALPTTPEIRDVARSRCMRPCLALRKLPRGAAI